MNIIGSFDRVVGVLYAVDKSIEKDKDIWYTNEAFTYYIGPTTDNRFVTVPKAFLTDGASVPRLFWNIFPPWGKYGQAAILHDYLCENRQLTNGGTGYKELLISQIDKIFYDAMKVSGVPVWTRGIIYLSVYLYHCLKIK